MSLSARFRCYHGVEGQGPTNGPKRAVFDCQDYSSIQRLMQVTANVLKFIDNLKSPSTNGVQTFKMGETARAEVLWIKKTVFGDRNWETLKKQFDLFLDREEVWRCGGRLIMLTSPIR